MDNKGTLVFFCGKMGAGKSTKAKEIAEEMSAVLLAEDDWLATLYPEEITIFDDYIKYSTRLKSTLLDHVKHLLIAGQKVVLDFPGNTKKQRDWFREILSGLDINHQLIYLDVPDDVCLQRLSVRSNEQPERAKFDTEEVFYQVTHYFTGPTLDEDFNVLVESVDY